MESYDEIRAMDTPEGHQKFMKAQWHDFATFAWKKYLSEGRGAVIVDLRNTSSNASAVQVPTYYVADGSKRLAERGGWPSDEIT